MLEKPLSAIARRAPWQRVRPFVWAGLVAAYAVLAVAWLWLPDPHRDGIVYALAAWAMFLVRTFAFHWGLAAAGGVLVALVGRRWALAAAIVPLAMVGLVPEYWTVTPQRLPVAGVTPLRVMTLNVFNRRGEPARVLKEIAATAPDVVCLQEYTPQWETVLHPALAGSYPYQAHAASPGARGMALYSRYPLVGPVEDTIAESPRPGRQMRAVVQAPGGPVVVYNVHLPTPFHVTGPRSQQAHLGRLLAVLEHETRPTVLCGDFNATQRGPSGDYLGALGFADVHVLAGHGRGCTWSERGSSRYFPGLRIDHVYVSPQLTALRTWVSGYVGSDHRAVIADVVAAQTIRP